MLESLLGKDGLSLSEAKRVATAQNLSLSADIGFGPYRKLVDYVNVADDEGKSLLHVVGTARFLPQHGETKENEQTIVEIKDTVRLLVNLGATLNSKAGDKTPLLSLLAQSNYWQNGAKIAAKELLNQGADPNIPDSKGATALHDRVRYRDARLIEDLLNAGANIEAKDDDLCTPLHWALKYSSDEAMQLIHQDADCKGPDRTGAKPANGFGIMLYPTVEMSTILVQKGADVQHADRCGVTPLHLAATVGKIRTVLFLMRYNANPEAVDMNGKTAMHYAALPTAIMRQCNDPTARYFETWFHLFKCSEQWCQRNKTRPRTLSKRTRSQILRTDHSWGDFGQLMSETLARS